MLCAGRSRAGIIVLWLFAFSTAVSWAGDPPQTQYQKFIGLSPKKREGKVRSYVRKKGDFWTVTRGIYTIYSTISPEKTLEYAIFMRDFAGRMDKFFEVKPKGKFKPIIYLCKDKDTMKDLMWEHFGKRSGGVVPEWAHGLYVPHLQNLYVIEDDQTKILLLHEGTHQFMHYLLGPRYRDLPVWINEGLAANFETWKMADPTQDNLKNCRKRSNFRFVIGEMTKEHPMPLTLAQLMGKDNLTWSGAKEKEVLYQYALAWSFTDYLLNTEKGKVLLKKVCRSAYAGKKGTIPKPVLKHHAQKWKEYVSSP